VWNNEDQADILEGVVQPVLEAFYREHPDRRSVGALGVGDRGPDRRRSTASARS
jgi:MoxR-like ATPase